MIKRRGLLKAAVLLIAAPAIVRATSLMPVRAFVETMPAISVPEWSAFQVFETIRPDSPYSWKQISVVMMSKNSAYHMPSGATAYIGDRLVTGPAMIRT